MACVPWEGGLLPCDLVALVPGNQPFRGMWWVMDSVKFQCCPLQPDVADSAVTSVWRWSEQVELGYLLC